MFKIINDLTCAAIRDGQCALPDYGVTNADTIYPRGRFSMRGPVAVQAACDLVSHTWSHFAPTDVDFIEVCGPMGDFKNNITGIIVRLKSVIDVSDPRFTKRQFTDTMFFPFKTNFMASNRNKISLDQARDLLMAGFPSPYINDDPSFISDRCAFSVAACNALNGFTFVPDDGDTPVESGAGCFLDHSTAASVGTGRWYGANAYAALLERSELSPGVPD